METGRISEGPGGAAGLVSSLSDKGKIQSILAINHIAHWGLGNHPYRLAASRFFPSFFQILRPPSPRSFRPHKSRGRNRLGIASKTPLAAEVTNVLRRTFGRPRSAMS